MGLECCSGERSCLPCIFKLSHMRQPGRGTRRVCLKRILLRSLKLNHKRSNTGWRKLILCLVSCTLSMKCGQRPEEANLRCSCRSSTLSAVSPLWNWDLCQTHWNVNLAQKTKSCWPTRPFPKFSSLKVPFFITLFSLSDPKSRTGSITWLLAGILQRSGTAQLWYEMDNTFLL